MDCIDAYGYLTGESVGDPEAVSLHIRECPSCSTSVEETRTLLSQLDLLPEGKPSSHVWEKLQEQVSPPSKKGMSFSVAAGLLLALFLGFFLSIERGRPVAAILADQRSLYIEEVFVSPDRSLLSLPGVGTLLVKAGSELSFTEPRKLVLLRGEVFAEIYPSGKGFEIVSGQARAVVLGTRFGVQAEKSVYVFEGRVDVVGPKGEIQLHSGEVADLSPTVLAQGLSAIDLDWVQSPRVSLTLQRVGKGVVSRDSSLIWSVTFSSSAPLRLEDLSRIHGPDHFLFLQVHSDAQAPYLIPIDPAWILSPGKRGVLIEPGTDTSLSFRLGSRSFRLDGRMEVFAIYTGKGTGGEQATSNPVEIEVKR